ncbi:uncharacterized protein V1518DRAFT_389694 [Limtongia smithiae]|uniref:uncharacterized protein n=1 Tax=Limtongia smithiae TaxID=1125753 RepID=UPI0034CE475C
MLLRLPDEILFQVGVQLDLRDVVAVASTCSQLHALLMTNDVFWSLKLRAAFDTTAVDPNTSSATAVPAVDVLAQRKLLASDQEHNMTLLYSTHAGAWGRSPATALSSSFNYATVPAAPVPAAASTTTPRRPRTMLEEYKLRYRLFLLNSPEARRRYASVDFRLQAREDVVSSAIRLLREHERKNYGILAASQLFSVTIFDQLVPGTFPMLQVPRLPSPSAFTMKPNAYILQQRIDMLRVIFGQRLSCASQTADVRELQAIVYDSSHFPLFTTAASTAATAVHRGLPPKRLSDSAWADIDILCDSSVVPRFDTLLAIINFFVYHSEENATVRDGLLPFFNTPPASADFNFKDKDTFDFPRDWTGLYSYLAFWDFDSIRRFAGLAAADVASSAGADAIDISDAPLTTLPDAAEGETVTADASTDDATAAATAAAADDKRSTSSRSDSKPTSSESLASDSPLSLRDPGLNRGSNHLSLFTASTLYPAPSVPQPPTVAKIQDQFDGFQEFLADLPAIHGPISFVGRGRDRYSYITYSTLAPLDACYGLPGFARFGMRKEYTYSDSDSVPADEDEVVWEYNGVYIPGAKILLGRWRDGTDPSVTNAVEGPFMFFADEL